MDHSVTGTIEPATMEFALLHLPRARQFAIRETYAVAVDHPHHVNTIEPALFSQRDLPHLERLELDLLPTIDRNTVLTPDVCELPNMAAPCLTSIYLRNILVSFPPSNLTELNIGFSIPTYLYTFTQFLDILRQCPRLQTMALQFCIPLPPVRQKNTSHPRLLMSSLTRFTLRDHANHCVGLWNSVDVPRSTAVFLTLHGVRDTYTSRHSHFEVISSVFQAPQPEQSSLGLSVFDSGAENTVIVLFEESAGTINLDWTGIFREGYAEQYNVRFNSVETDPPHFLQLLSRALSSVEPKNITALEIRSVYHYDLPSWTTSLMPFTHLRTLYIERMPRSSLLLSLIAPDEGASPSGAPFILPNLQFLWLSALDLRTADDQVALDRFSFSRIFSSRAKRGAQIQHLRIEKLMLDRTLAESVVLPRLRALVPLVECDSIVEGAQTDPPYSNFDIEAEIAQAE